MRCKPPRLLRVLQTRDATARREQPRLRTTPAVYVRSRGAVATAAAAACAGRHDPTASHRLRPSRQATASHAPPACCCCPAASSGAHRAAHARKTGPGARKDCLGADVAFTSAINLFPNARFKADMAELPQQHTASGSEALDEVRARWRVRFCASVSRRSRRAQAERLLVAGSFAEAAEAAQRVLSEAKRDGAAPRDDADDEGEDLTVAAAAVLLQARRFQGDSAAALRTLLESAFASLHAVPPEALLLWCVTKPCCKPLRLPSAPSATASCCARPATALRAAPSCRR